MEKEFFTIKNLEGDIIISFVDWYYTPEDVFDIYGDVIVENSDGEQVLTW